MFVLFNILFLLNDSIIALFAVVVALLFVVFFNGIHSCFCYYHIHLAIDLLIGTLFLT